MMEVRIRRYKRSTSTEEAGIVVEHSEQMAAVCT
jgi:hypothetical protein